MKTQPNHTYKLILILLLAMVSFIACDNAKVKISGQFADCKQDYFVLYQIYPDDLQRMDTVALLNGRFSHSFKGDQIGAYRMQFSDTLAIVFIAQRGEKLVFSGDGRNLQQNYDVQGSEETRLLLQNNRKLDTLNRKVSKLTAEFRKYAYENYSDSAVAVLDSLYYSYFNAHKQYLRDFIHAHPDKLVARFAFYQTLGRNVFFSVKNDSDLFREIYLSLSKKYPDNIYVIDIKEKLEEQND